MRRAPRPLAIPVTLVISLSGCMTMPSSAPAAVSPQRPGISTDANLTPTGILEYEAGVTHDPHDRLALNSLAKWGVNDQTEAYVGVEPLVHRESSGPEGMGFGDMQLGFRHLVWVDEQGRKAAADFRVYLPTADEGEGLGTGEMALRTSGALTQQIGDLSVNGYARLGFLGEREGEGLDLEYTFAASVIDPLWTGVTGFAEVAGVFLPEQDQEDVLLTVGLYRSFSSNLVLDLALRAGLTSDSPDTAILVGVTNNVRPQDW